MSEKRLLCKISAPNGVIETKVVDVHMEPKMMVKQIWPIYFEVKNL
jgi:hypothetical protein